MRANRLLVRLTEWSIPRDLREFNQPEDIERGRMVCATLLASAALVGGGAFLSIFSDLFPPELKGMFVRVSSGLAIAYIATLVVFNRTAAFALAAHLYATSSFVIYVANLPGLPPSLLQSLLIPILAIPLFAASIGGLGVGLFWLVIIGATPVAIVYFSPAMLGQASEVSSFFIGAWLVLSSAIAFSLWCFNYIASHMRYRLNEECARFAFDAAHDPLTGLANRTVFARRLAEAIEYARLSREVLALMYIDLNDFKPINDRYGHNAGDAVLVAVAQRLGGLVRQSDTVARLGGDEFVVLYRHLKQRAHLDNCVARMHQAIAEPIQVGGQFMQISASMGVVCYPDDADNADALQARADALMYESKQRRKTAIL